MVCYFLIKSEKVATYTLPIHGPDHYFEPMLSEIASMPNRNIYNQSNGSDPIIYTKDFRVHRNCEMFSDFLSDFTNSKFKNIPFRLTTVNGFGFRFGSGSVRFGFRFGSVFENSKVSVSVRFGF